MQYLDAVSKMTEWFLHCQGKRFNTVIQVYAKTNNAQEVKLNSSMKIYKTF